MAPPGPLQIRSNKPRGPAEETGGFQVWRRLVDVERLTELGTCLVATLPVVVLAHVTGPGLAARRAHRPMHAAERTGMARAAIKVRPDRRTEDRVDGRSC